MGSAIASGIVFIGMLGLIMLLVLAYTTVQQIKFNGYLDGRYPDVARHTDAYKGWQQAYYLRGRHKGEREALLKRARQDLARRRGEL